MGRRWWSQGGFGVLILALLVVDIVLMKAADERMFLGDFTVEGRVVTASHGSVTFEGYTLAHSTGEAQGFFTKPTMKVYNNYYNGDPFTTTYVGHAFRNGGEIKLETLRQGQRMRATGKVIKDYRQLVPNDPASLAIQKRAVFYRLDVLNA
jgi:hypothetical protein